MRSTEAKRSPLARDGGEARASRHAQKKKNTRKTHYQCGFKLYEQSNHLGNVLVTLTDKQRGIDAGSNGTLDYYLATVQTATHYYPFGWELVAMQYGAGYRYGFNGKEDDGETKTTDFGARFYDERSGRWWGVDRLTLLDSYLSPYVFVKNSPVNFVDIDGNKWRNPYRWSLDQLLKMPLDKQDANEIARLTKAADQVDRVIEELKSKDPELYDYIENLTHSGREVLVPVYLLNNKGTVWEEKEKGKDYGYVGYKIITRGGGIEEFDGEYPNVMMADKKEYNSNISLIESVGKPTTKWAPNQINIFLNTNQPQDEMDNTLANEIGDVMFAVEYTRLAKDTEESVPYENRRTSLYSFNVEYVYTKKEQGKYSPKGNSYPLVLKQDNASAAYTQDGFKVNEYYRVFKQPKQSKNE